MDLESSKIYIDGLYAEYTLLFNEKPKEKRAWYAIQMVNSVLKILELDIEKEKIKLGVYNTLVTDMPDFLS